MSSKWSKGSSGPAGDEIANLVAQRTGGGFDVAHSLRGEGFDASEDGTGRGTPLVPISFGAQNAAAQGDGIVFDFVPALVKNKTPAVAFDMDGAAHCLRSGASKADKPDSTTYIAATPWAVRRLTPRECERLQGFPDDFTRIPYRNKPADLCPDGPRYKALGNSWAVNCADWIGERIAEVETWNN
jgi:DNA (cytosine-5)-methyltransferase 1